MIARDDDRNKLPVDMVETVVGLTIPTQLILRRQLSKYFAKPNETDLSKLFEGHKDPLGSLSVSGPSALYKNFGKITKKCAM